MTQERELERKIEALAMDPVMAEGPEAGETDNSLRLLAAALAGIESLATERGFAEVSQTADQLRLVIGSALDSGSGWEGVAGALQEGILRLQKALEPASAAPPANMDNQALALDRDPRNAEAIRAMFCSMFCSFHSMKGLAGHWNSP